MRREGGKEEREGKLGEGGKDGTDGIFPQRKLILQGKKERGK